MATLPSTVLFKAINESDHALIQNYLNTKGDANFSNGTLLRLAIIAEDLTMVHILVQGGAKVGLNNHQAIRVAAAHGNMDIIQYLIDHGGDPTLGEMISKIMGQEKANEFLYVKKEEHQLKQSIEAQITDRKIRVRL